MSVRRWWTFWRTRRDGEPVTFVERAGWPLWVLVTLVLTVATARWWR